MSFLNNRLNTTNFIDFYVKINKILQETFKIKMLEKLKDRVKDPVVFCQNMKKYEVFMSGSILLQVMLGEEWESDIDLYVFSKEIKDKSIPASILSKIILNTEKLEELYENKSISKFFTKIDGKIYSKYDVDKESKFIYSLRSDTDLYPGLTTEDKIYNTDSILRVGNYRYVHAKKETNIQIIHIDKKNFSNIADFVEEFDLDFCKIIFDGEKFTMLYPDSVINCTSKYNKTSDWQDRKDMRIEHYKKRGFTITDDKNKSTGDMFCARYAQMNHLGKIKKY